VTKVTLKKQVWKHFGRSSYGFLYWLKKDLNKSTYDKFCKNGTDPTCVEILATSNTSKLFAL